MEPSQHAPVALLAGRSTEDGTRRFRDRALSTRGLPPSHFRTAPGGLALASFGLGTYLGEPDSATDLAVEEAAGLCLRSGRTNVLDTAINYRFQRAERSVGRALARVVESGGVARDEIFLATKNGYLSPDAESPIPPARYIETELIRPGILRPSEIVDGSHAMSVGFLRDQFERSRRNLGVATIDLMYLHNAPDAQIPSIGRAEFLERLRSVFELYESLRATGELGSYGLATWESLRSPRTGEGYLSVRDAVRVAEEVGGAGHGFRFLQFPFNLAMPEAAVLRNQPIDGERSTLFDAARHHGLGCFTSVPLLQGQLARDGPRADGWTRAQFAIQFARSAPGTLGPLVGQKDPGHLAENLRVAESPPWDEDRFRALLDSR